MDADTRERLAREIEFHDLTVDDLEEISGLITGMSRDGESLRLRDKSAAYYRWMYFENPAGQAFGCLARHEGRVVCSFAVAPKAMQVDGRRVLLGKTMDMFTHPDYQGLGLMGRCADQVFARAREGGLEGWYVTPSVNSYPIFKRWGYREDFVLHFRARPLDVAATVASVRPRAGRWASAASRAVAPLARLLDRTPRLPAGWSVAEEDTFGPEVDDLWRRVGGGYRVAIVRDAGYLRWRYSDNPDDYAVLALRRDGVLRGLAVLKVTVRHGLAVGEVVDVVAPARDARTWGLLLRHAVDVLRRRGCAVVEAWAIRGTWVDRRLIRSGLAIPRATLPFLLSPDLGEPAVHDPEAWLLSQGDGNDV
ncbi:GNAT family N-acetyltransferase [Propioniciclava sp. MC1683]|uniref:GNAT family N-acetyltransferase n=1 Tax=Propioniciclava sp. MC1683 TaxID=2760309 RepID=UPI00160138C1|nr:GNAT family N-acetyltransferase [Propioniciclava sp. MC1683]MBB1502241.1 GNAT family N-acetyltransferase [Propioniciclava sp. MC1683]